MHRKVCVIGLGYVGLTLAVTLAENNEVYGVDTSESVIEGLQKGVVGFYEKGLAGQVDRFHRNNLSFSTTIPGSTCDFYVICVGTPIDSYKKPIFLYLENAVRTVSENLKEGDTVILRSTVPDRDWETQIT